VPVGFYTVEVQGNSFYQSASKVVNLVNEEDKDEIVIYVGIRPRIDADIEFMFFQELNDKKVQLP
jgi:hypothetical protein